MATKVLSNIARNEPVEFDAENRDHVIAYMALAQYGKQHPTLRFHLERPYIDIKAMMEAKLAAAYAKRFIKVDESVQKLLNPVDVDISISLTGVVTKTRNSVREFSARAA